MKKKVPKKAVVLLSGGIDSATCLYLAIRQGFVPHCLIFNYGQRHTREIVSAKKIARKAKCGYSVCGMSFPWKGSSLIDKSLEIPVHGRGIPSTYVPGRNIIFLSFALSCAEAIKAEAVFIGANVRDFSGYPDCRPEFYRSFKSVARTGLKSKAIKILTPLLHKSKAEIIKIGLELSVPYYLCWSCYRGADKPCGRCDSCRFRARGFRQANLKDPAL